MLLVGERIYPNSGGPAASDWVRQRATRTARPDAALPTRGKGIRPAM